MVEGNVLRLPHVRHPWTFPYQTPLPLAPEEERDLGISSDAGDLESKLR